MPVMKIEQGLRNESAAAKKTSLHRPDCDSGLTNRGYKSFVVVEEIARSEQSGPPRSRRTWKPVGAE